MTMSNITEGDNNVSFGSPSSTSTLTTASTCLLDPRHAGRVVAAEFGIVRATVPFHGEHDALEPTKEGLRFSTVRLPTPQTKGVRKKQTLWLKSCDALAQAIVR